MHTDHGIYRFRFNQDVPMAEVHESLKLAIFAAEGVHGAAQVRLGFGYCCDDATRCHVLDARAEAGCTVVRIFTGFLTQQFGEEAFRVEPCRASQAGERHDTDGR